MIPKIIHFFWLGNKPMNNLTHICLNSCKEKIPEYKITIWNEKNLDLNKLCKSNKFLNECRKRNLYAFMVDYLRLYILYKYGGVYMDTDVQVIKNFDEVVQNNSFTIGYECGNHIGTGFIACEMKSYVVEKILKFYDNEIWKQPIYTIPSIFEYVFKKNQEELKDIHIYSVDYFSPHNYNVEFNEAEITKFTYTIHWFDGSWTDKLQVRTFLCVKHIHNPVLKCFAIFRQYLGFLFRKIIPSKKF